MIPSGGSFVTAPKSIPRESGDDPYYRVSVVDTGKYSPRERG